MGVMGASEQRVVGAEAGRLVHLTVRLGHLTVKAGRETVHVGTGGDWARLWGTLRAALSWSYRGLQCIPDDIEPDIRLPGIYNDINIDILILAFALVRCFASPT